MKKNLLPYLKNFDKQLFFSVCALIFLSFFFLFSTNFDPYGGSTSIALFFIKKHFFSFLFGAFVFFLTIQFDYRLLKKSANIIYVLVLCLLLIVLNTEQTISGVQRWLSLGPFTFQPSELAKLGLIIIIASYFSNYQNKQYKTLLIENFSEIIPALILAFIPFLLVFKQPDLGTAFVFLALSFGMCYWAGTRPLLLLLLISPLLSVIILQFIPGFPWLFWVLYLCSLIYTLYIKKINVFESIFFFILNVVTGLSLPMLWNSLKLYQQQRILSFINPGLDPLAQGARYHAAKSVIAIGSGKFAGQGFLKGPLTHLHYIPEQHTDFIFTVIGEEFGFLGTTFILFIFGYILFRGVQIASNSQDRFGSFLAIGIVILLATQIVFNIGMTLGLLPVVGIPLPFISFGGSSLLISIITIGLLESIAIHQNKDYYL
jgi:rod shape determining protein RodA